MGDNRSYQKSTGKVINYVKTRNVNDPEYGNVGDAGIDFFVPNDFKGKVLEPGEDINIPSGIKMSLPPDTVLIAFEKSGVSLKHKLHIGAKVIDESYQGEIHLHVFNAGQEAEQILPGQKLVQFILLPVYYAGLIRKKSESDVFIKKTERGEKNFGSTGEGKITC